MGITLDLEVGDRIQLLDKNGDLSIEYVVTKNNPKEDYFLYRYTNVAILKYTSKDDPFFFIDHIWSKKSFLKEQKYFNIIKEKKLQWD